MKRVLKYHVVPDGDTIEMPRGARVLSAGAQGENLVVWALTDHVQANMEQRRVTVVSTGEYLTDELVVGCDFVGTVQMQVPVVADGDRRLHELVLHVWADRSDWAVQA